MWAHGRLADFLKILLQVHDSVRLFLLPKLISLDSIVHVKTEMQIHQENISALKILNPKLQRDLLMTMGSKGSEHQI